MSTFWLEFWTEKDDFCIYAEGEEYKQELRLEGQARAISAQFATIYDILEHRRTSRAKELETAIEELSAQLLAPFAGPLKACDLVRIVAYEDVIRCVFDLLLLDSRYLFLQQPVCYQVLKGEGEDAPTIELESALLIADLTADPEEACQEVAALFPNATYAKVSDANLGMIRAAADQVIAQLEAWVVYFDACQQGVNETYLHTMPSSPAILCVSIHQTPSPYASVFPSILVFGWFRACLDLLTS